jgi:hypothetical protein
MARFELYSERCPQELREIWDDLGPSHATDALEMFLSRRLEVTGVSVATIIDEVEELLYKAGLQYPTGDWLDDYFVRYMTLGHPPIREGNRFRNMTNIPHSVLSFIVKAYCS